MPHLFICHERLRIDCEIAEVIGKLIRILFFWSSFSCLFGLFDNNYLNFVKNPQRYAAFLFDKFTGRNNNFSKFICTCGHWLN